MLEQAEVTLPVGQRVVAHLMEPRAVVRQVVVRLAEPLVAEPPAEGRLVVEPVTGLLEGQRVAEPLAVGQPVVVRPVVEPVAHQDTTDPYCLGSRLVEAAHLSIALFHSPT